MPRKLNDFECPNGHVFEELVESGVEKHDCPTCSSEATLILTRCGFKLDGTDPAYPTAYDRWAKVRAEKVKLETKQKAS